MSWKVTTETAAPIIPEGEYAAMAVDVRDAQGPHGPLARIDFMLSSEDEFDGRQVSGIAGRKLSENTNLGRWIAAILGRMPAVGEEVAIADLLHKECRVVVKHKSNDEGQVFANVVQVLAAVAQSE